MTSNYDNNFSKGTDFAVIVLYLMMACIGILAIFMVEYNPNADWATSFISGKTSYSKQFFFLIFCSFSGSGAGRGYFFSSSDKN